MIYVDDLLPNHRKVLKAARRLDGDPNARVSVIGLFICALSYSRLYLTDGVVPRDYLLSCANHPKLIDAMRFAGLLEHRPDGTYQVHDYPVWNKSAAKVLHERELTRERLRRYRGRLRADREGGNAGETPLLDGCNAPETQAHGSTIHDPRTTYPSTTDPDPSDQDREQPSASRADDVENDDDDGHVFDSPVFDPPRPRRRQQLATDPNGDNYRVISKIVREAIADGTREDELVAEVKERAARKQIDYGRQSGSYDVVHRAVESELFKHKHPDLVGARRRP